MSRNIRKANDYWSYYRDGGSLYLLQFKERCARKLRAKGVEIFSRRELEEHMYRKFRVHELNPAGHLIGNNTPEPYRRSYGAVIPVTVRKTRRSTVKPMAITWSP